MTDKLREQSIEFAKKHLFECAKEILDWGRTSILCDGKLRELAKTCEAWVRDEIYALGVAEAIVKEEALRAALAQQDAQQDVDWEKLYRLEVKKKEALAAKYERDIKPLTKIVPLAQTAQQDAQAVAQPIGYARPFDLEALQNPANPTVLLVVARDAFGFCAAPIYAAPTPPAQQEQPTMVNPAYQEVVDAEVAEAEARRLRELQAVLKQIEESKK